MRKAITMLVVLALSVSLWADNVHAKKIKGLTQLEKNAPTHRINTNNNDRTQSYTLDMYDAFGDGWNGGASLDLFVNDVLILDDATVAAGSEASASFDVEVGDVITTTWTAGTWDSECYYLIYNDADILVAEAGIDSNPELTLTHTVTPTHIAVMFTEYSEGASNNKYLEIYNGTDAEVDLTGLAFASVANAPSTVGEYEYWNTFDAGATVASGEVFVITHPDAAAAILAEGDQTHQYLSNGDDGYCLVLGTETSYTILDCIGDWNGDPGSGWDVAGVVNGTQNNTLERKGSVTFGNAGDWVASAGTDVNNSEWTVSANTVDADGAQNGDWDGLGSATPTEVLGCMDATANNYDATATIDDGSCDFTVTCETNDILVTMTDSFNDGWNGNVLTIGDNTLDGPPSGGSPSTASLCLDDGSYTVTCDGGSWQGEVSWQITNAATGEVLLEGGAPYSGVLALGTTEVLGCTDPTALNYDADATFDDGSCYYVGEVCESPLDFVTEGGALDGSAPATGSIESLGAHYYAFTLDQAWENLSISLEGSTYDTKLDLYDPGCGTLQATNDDNGGGGLWSLIELTDVPAGSHVVKVYAFGSGSGDYVLTINAYQTPAVITDLTALGGISRVYLGWSPMTPAGTQTSVIQNNDDQLEFSSIEEQIQWEYDNKKYPSDEITGYRAPTREQLMVEIANEGQNTRDTEVLVTLFDAYGDGHDGAVYIKDGAGTVLHTLDGGWTGTEAAFGPFTLADGYFFLEWDANATWLSEQTAEITLVSDGTVVGAGAAMTFCFTLGEGQSCPEPDLTVTSISYNPMNGYATATISNIGNGDVTANFWAIGFLAEPDMTELYPPAYYCWALVGPLAAGESAEVTLTGGSALTDLYGYDDETYTIYVAADGFGMLVTETDETNNVSMIEVVNSNPLANTTWNVWRDAGTEPIGTVSGAAYIPGTAMEYLDVDVTAGTQYCYLVTQVDGTSESGVSNQSCATPSAPPVVPGPTDLTGSSAGFNVSLTWTAPEPAAQVLGEGLGTPSSTRQGGDDMSTATVITELTQLTGTTVDYFDDYDEDCGAGTSDAGDVVYAFTPAEDMAIDLTTCYSDYDTKMFVYENAPGVLASTVTGGPNSACSDDTDWPGADDCTAWTSFIPGLFMAAGNTYYIVIDGWGGSEGNYVVDFYPYDPFQGYTIWTLDAGATTPDPVGQAGPTATEWSTVLYAAEPTEFNFLITANYVLPGIFDPVSSDPVGPVTLTIQMEDNPNNLMAMGHGDDVHLTWDPPTDASTMELIYHDGTMANASWYAGAVAVRFRVSGTYAVNGLTNAVWTGGWPDAVLGETPFTLSVLALDPETDLPGEVLHSEDVLVDADPTSETYGWAMTSELNDDPLVVTGDVFVVYSDFGYDWANGTAGADMDMMGCDGILDFPGNRYSYLGEADALEGVNGEWTLDVTNGDFGFCGDWMLHMHADFTAGDGLTTAGNNGIWINQSGAPSLEELPAVYADMEMASTKENPVELTNPPVSDPVFAGQTLDRDMLHYNIYRDGEVVGDQAPGVHEYMDGGLDWGTYEYHVTAMYDDHESIATNMVSVTLSNVPPNAVMLISPGDGLEVEVTEDNLDETVAFIWTAAIDDDNDPVEYWLDASGLIGVDTVYGGAPDFNMENEGFEENADGTTTLEQIAPWGTWPPELANFSFETEGNGIYNSDATLEVYDGDHALKIWGQYGDTQPNNTPIYQGFNVEDHGLSAGDEVVAFGSMMSHADDWVGQGENSAYLFISFFDADWNWMQSDLGPRMDASKAASEWHEFDVSATVPEGAVMMNVGVEYWQVSGNDHGSVYFDEIDWYSPVTTTGLFIPYSVLAEEAYDAGVTDITWTWDVWSYDGFEVTPSSSGPRALHVYLGDWLGIDAASLPKEFALHNNYPNPFNPVTNIVYDIPEATDVTLEIYNVMGQRVRTLAQGSHEAGRYQIVWNATNDIGQALSSGMYIYRIQAGDFVSVKKLVLMK